MKMNDLPEPAMVRPAEHAHAGLGWVQRADDGRGLFIALHADSRERLERDLHAAFGAIPSMREPEKARCTPRSRRGAATACGALIVVACACEPW
jgi:hypothetical protein